MAKAPPKAQPKAAAKSVRKPVASSLHEPPSRATFTKAVLDDLVRPLSPADATELFAAKVVDIARKFDLFWFHLVAELATQVLHKCDEQVVKATLEEVATDLDGLRAHLIRRRINRALPIAPGESRLTETERYELARAVVVAACETVKDESLWDALWGRKADWSPVVRIDDDAEANAENEGLKSGGAGYRTDREHDAAD